MKTLRLTTIYFIIAPITILYVGIIISSIIYGLSASGQI